VVTGFSLRNMRDLRRFGALLLAAGWIGCGLDDSIFDAEEWDVAAEVTPEALVLTATIADVHGDFIHMSIRRDGHDNAYTVERSPGPSQETRDGSRVHTWFEELHPDTYLEGRIDDGRGRGPSRFQSYRFLLPRIAQARQDYEDEHGSEYVYITRGYSYADGHGAHPGFPAGTYEVEIYAWYTGRASARHPSIDDFQGVQYVHYEQPLASTTFVVE
jgi:hypothetical protein